MQQSIGLLDLPATASGAVTARRGVDFAGAQATVQGQKVMGVAVYDAVGTGPLAVRVIGTALVETGGAFANGDPLIVDTQGRAIASTGPLALKAGATAVTSAAANGAVLQGGDAPEFVFADALAASSAAGVFVEVLLRR